MQMGNTPKAHSGRVSEMETFFKMRGLFKRKLKGEVKRVKYAICNIYLRAKLDNTMPQSPP